MKSAVLICLAALLAFATVPAQAGTDSDSLILLTATLEGFDLQETINGTGIAAATLNTDTMEFSWFVAWQGLTGLATIGTFGLDEIGVDVRGGNDLGFDTSSNPAVGVAILTASQAAELLENLWSVTIGTDQYPGGEIGGRITVVPPAVVPLPAAAWLMFSALGALGFIRRKQA